MTANAKVSPVPVQPGWDLLTVIGRSFFLQKR